MAKTPRITICPPGRVEGCKNLQRWAARRSGGRSGTGRYKQKDGKPPSKIDWFGDDADSRQWLRKHGYKGQIKP